MTATFTWIPSPGAKEARKPRVLSAKFGDGYEQRAVDGINADFSTWSVDFLNKSRSGDGAAIAAFLAARAGAESFNWTDPNGKAALWLCRSWETTLSDPWFMSISATFEQVPA